MNADSPKTVYLADYQPFTHIVTGVALTFRLPPRATEVAAVLHFARDLGIEVPPSQVIVSAGGKQAIFHALLATVDPSDEVLIPAPWWVSYPEIVRFAGAEPVAIPTTPSTGYRISADQLAAAITPRTRWLLLNSPGNPTGAV